MKKISWSFIGIQVAAVLVVSFLISTVFSLCNYGEFDANAVVTMTFVVGVMVGALYLGLSGILMRKLAAGTVKKNVAAQHFENCSTFYSSNATIKIDQATGRIAYISQMNPFAFQVISAKDIDDIKSDYAKGPFGGTNYVYFQFSYKGKKYKLPTFTANRQMYSLKSAEVLEGISKADAYAEMLLNAKNNAAV